MSVSRPTGVRTALRWLLPGAVAAVVPTLVTTAILVGVIWPGLLEFTAPLACPPGFPDAFVQEHVFSIPGEIRRSWSLLCMSEYGAIHRPGQFLPWLALAGGTWLLLSIAIAVALASPAARRRRRKGR